ncbi:MAG TPA: cysteine peptidase family C39 domain-containing protein [Polyangia bacterium]|nr:cysteine peptidase family C39 domain-containing protein [Polyangia bacterium]
MRSPRRLSPAIIAVALALAFCPLGEPFVAAFGTQGISPPRLLPVPLVSQARPWSCGAAALMAALVYFGVFDDAESRLDAALGSTPEDGTRVTRIVAEARRYGLDVESRTGMTLDELAGESARGAVVIVALQAWPNHKIADWRTSWEDGHYVDVVGVDATRVYVMDPSVRTGYAYLPRDEFLARWHDYDLENGTKAVYDRLGIAIRGGGHLARFPADPTPVR